ncbi:sulfurtransferase [Oceanobacillus halophilus]|uniref:Sulfurtransferase n=1 Tax=Oceanobacillus halophilus TaxID=930130 RepID=A0A495A4G7_9BACI|nr:sulfurtransferase [Oceanobacillus halophilus]RKQ33197.1 sulfurtransferase [Oceanobacillus halophilus]
MSYIMSVNELREKLDKDSQNTVIVDVRFVLTDPDAGRKMYLKNHLPSAVYLDLNRDLSGKVAKHGGSHPLPDIAMFAAKTGNIGIDHETTVVIYDQENDMFASRLWWLLHYMGHDNVFVLEGGYNKWVEKGFEVTDKIPPLVKKEFKPKIREEQTVTMEQVKQKMDDSAAILIDSRARDRYLGIKEPLYSKAGHIPGAKNFFWQDVFNEDGTWKTINQLQEHFSSLEKDEEIIVSCGSGVSACPNILALKSLGYKNIKLYPGSFSDWISYDENDIELDEY